MSPPETLCLVVGSPRSGTTLATRLLLEIEAVSGPPLETHFFEIVTPLLVKVSGREFDVEVWEPILRQYTASPYIDGVQLDADAILRGFDGWSAVTPAQIFRAVVHALTPEPGSILLEKTPLHLWSWPIFADDPAVKFVALVRDPRAVVESTLRQWWGSNDVTEAACWWLEEQRELRRMRAALGGSRVLSYRYEDLIADSAAFRKGVARFLGVHEVDRRPVQSVGRDSLFPAWESGWKQDAAGPIDSSRLNAWRDRVGFGDIVTLERVCGAEMRSLGYALLSDDGDNTLASDSRPDVRTVRHYAGVHRSDARRLGGTLDPAASPLKVAVLSRFPMSERHDAADGFSARNRFLLDLLAARNDVMIVYIGTDDEFVTEACRTTRGDVDVAALSFTPSSAQSRGGRIAAATRLLVSGGRRPAPWEESLMGLLQGWQPDLVLGFVREHWQLARVPACVYPTALFVEEDFYRLPGWMTKSTPWGRALERFEHTAAAYSVRGSTTRVVISPAERRWARRRFLGCDVHVVPHWIDIDYWTVRVPPAPELSERDVFVLNHMGQARNAVGLREIADALVRRCGEGAPRLLVASSEAPHEALRDAHLGVVQFLGYVEDPRPYYRAKVALVPSFEVTGTKTTILQAWAAGCPVVTTTRAAASVGATSGAEVLAGSDPNEVAAMLVRVLRDDDLANDLVENGRKRLTQAYGSAAARDALDEVLAATVRRSRRHR